MDPKSCYFPVKVTAGWLFWQRVSAEVIRQCVQEACTVGRRREVKQQRQPPSCKHAAGVTKWQQANIKAAETWQTICQRLIAPGFRRNLALIVRTTGTESYTRYRTRVLSPCCSQKMIDVLGRMLLAPLVLVQITVCRSITSLAQKRAVLQRRKFSLFGV